MIYSYSLINTFHEVCPRQAHERWWLKVKAIEGPEMKAGFAAHTALQKRLQHGNRLPDDLQDVEPICEAFMARGIPLTETKMGVDADLKAVGFWDADCFIRSVADVALYNPTNTSVFIGDWKTGKPREDGEPLQLMILAASAFALTPALQSATAANIYTKTAKMGTVHSWQRSELPGLWRSIIPLIDEIEDAEDAVINDPANTRKAFPERPSGLCGYCPVLNCQHNRAA